jgi:hypothetical protein
LLIAEMQKCRNAEMQKSKGKLSIFLSYFFVPLRLFFKSRLKEPHLLDPMSFYSKE